MKSHHTSHVLSVRVPSAVMTLIDQVAALLSCDRSQAVRHIILSGAPLLIAGKAINLTRVLMTLEIVAEDCLARAEARGQAELRALLETAQANLERHHA